MFFKKKEKVLVTGGAGFIGSHLVDALINKGQKVVVVDNLSTGQKQNLNKKAKFFKMDIGDAKLEKIFKKYTITHVFHCAAQINLRESVKDPINDADTNILGALNLLENACHHGVKKVVFSSTGGAIYGDASVVPTPETFCAKPISPYGIAKLTVEHYLHYYNTVWGLNYTVLRYANVYGPRQNSKSEAGVISIFCNKILNSEQPVINGTGKQTRDYVYVGDVVAANLLAWKSPKIGIYNVGTGIETNVNQLFELIKQNFDDYDVDVEHGPAMPGEQKRSCLDTKKIKHDLGWQPKVELGKGIKLTAKWFRENN